jgi:serine/threonine protein kinase/CHASE3 domain sensor protein
LAKGGFGETYVAEDTRLPGNPQCVVKHLKPSSSNTLLLENAKRLFLIEAETLQKLGKHDQIPQLLAYFEENREFYLVQELIQGHTLTRELTPGRVWTEPQVYRLLWEILGILSFIHRHDVIHRDIKPDNLIRRRPDQKFVLVDFGTVKQSVANQGQSNTTIIAGTPGYMPTEQGRGKPRPSSDIYALGIIGIQALTGLKPSELQEDLATGELLWRPWASCSEEIATILEKMVRYHFKERYTSAEDALQDLEPLMDQEPAIAELETELWVQPRAADSVEAVELDLPSAPTLLSQPSAEAATALSLPLMESLAATSSEPSAKAETPLSGEVTELETNVETVIETNIPTVVEAAAATSELSELTDLSPAAETAEPVQTLLSLPLPDKGSEGKAPELLALASPDLQSDPPQADLPQAASFEADSEQNGSVQSEGALTLLSQPAKSSQPVQPPAIATPTATVLSPSPAAGSPASPVPDPAPVPPATRQWRWIVIGGGIAIAALLGGSVYWFQQRQAYLSAQAALEAVQSSKLAGRYQDCIQQAKAVLSGYADLQTQSQTLLGECLLAQAKTLAGERKFKDAIAQVTQVSADFPVYAEAQTLMSQWAEEILQTATNAYRKGNLKEAEAIVKAIPADAALAQEAQQSLDQWRSEWNKNEALLKTAQQALDKKQWDNALAETAKLRLLNQPVPQNSLYWKAKIEPIATKAEREIAAAEAARLEAARSQPISNSPVYSGEAPSGDSGSPQWHQSDPSPPVSAPSRSWPTEQR